MRPPSTPNRRVAGGAPHDAPHDAIIVLGAVVLPDGRPSPALRRRALHAAALWRAGRAPCLIVSGGLTGGPVSEARVMLEILRENGVPAEAVLLDEAATRTLENARNALAITRDRGWRRLIVATDGYHLPRAWLTFRLLGETVVGSRAPGAFAAAPALWIGLVLRELLALPAYAAILLLVRHR